ncbi:phospholipase D-like domain-containing protein [Yersinia frederiksenii]|nr:phospholipase D-like domain-containing protein [Yersinia frederiksenii]
MHNKIILADSNTLQTGSYNYSASANKRNAENVLVVRNQPQLVAVYE